MHTRTSSYRILEPCVIYKVNVFPEKGAIQNSVLRKILDYEVWLQAVLSHLQLHYPSDIHWILMSVQNFHGLIGTTVRLAFRPRADEETMLRSRSVTKVTTTFSMFPAQTSNLLLSSGYNTVISDSALQRFTRAVIYTLWVSLLYSCPERR